MAISYKVPETLEEAREVILAYQEAERTLEGSVKALTDTTSEQSKRVTELQEHNQRLFLKLTTQEEHKQEEEKHKTLDELLPDLKGKF